MWRMLLSATEGEELLNQFFGPVAGRIYFIEIFLKLLIGRLVILGEFSKAEYCTENIIEIMGDSTGKDADGFEFPGLLELAFKIDLLLLRSLTFGDIARNGE